MVVTKGGGWGKWGGFGHITTYKTNRFWGSNVQDDDAS